MRQLSEKEESNARIRAESAKYARERFAHVCGRAGLPDWAAAEIMRCAATLHRIAERECNGETECSRWPTPCSEMLAGDRMSGRLCADHRRDDSAMRRVRALVGPHAVKFGGDPRGAVVKVEFPAALNAGDCFAERGWTCVPQRERRRAELSA